jgi:HSP20 family protein
MPKVDVSETKDSVVVRAEIPGMEAKDIQVSLRRTCSRSPARRSRRRRKRTSGTTAWSAATARSRGACALPAGVEAGKVNAAFKNGVLMVTLPKTAAAKATPIPVKAES